MKVLLQHECIEVNGGYKLILDTDPSVGDPAIDEPMIIIDPKDLGRGPPGDPR